MNLGIWGDGGCLGCTTKRRRIFFMMIVVGCLIAAGVLYLLDQDANQNTCLSLLGGAGIFLVVAVCFPDGLCG
jgi:hypothetical protein